MCGCWVLLLTFVQCVLPCLPGAPSPPPPRGLGLFFISKACESVSETRALFVILCNLVTFSSRKARP